MQQKPKIAFLSCYSGIVSRGVETFESELAKRLVKQFDMTVFTGGASKRPNIKTITIKTFFSQPKSSFNALGMFYLDLQSIKILLFTIRFVPYLLKNRYKIIFVLNGGWQTLIVRIFSKITGSKLVVTGQAGVGYHDLVNILFRPDVYVALTTSQYNWAQHLSSELKISLIPNGVDLSKFNPKVETANIDLQKPVVICVSGLDKHKRVDLTIKAVARAKLSLLLLGDGELRGQIDTLGKRLLGKRYLRLTVAHEQTPKYYRCADVFTLVSKTEAFGIAYIEALACNLPAVATNDSSRQEIIGNAGILTNPDNIDKYAKDLKIAASTNYRNIPYDQALKFSWNNIAKKYSTLIKSLVV